MNSMILPFKLKVYTHAESITMRTDFTIWVESGIYLVVNEYHYTL